MSAKNPVIVSGEAPETDSEDETPIPATVRQFFFIIRKTVIS